MVTSVRPLDYENAPPVGRRCAYVVFLLTNDSYLPGILVLALSLRHVKSRYPLVVAIPSDATVETHRALAAFGLEVRKVEPLLPQCEVNIRLERFEDTWSKMKAFGFLEYDFLKRVVLLDADMLVRRNLDELFNFPMEPNQIACSTSCNCNLKFTDWVPDDWKHEDCPFLRLHHQSSEQGLQRSSLNSDHESQTSKTPLNSGLVVLSPSQTTMSRITRLLMSPSPDDQQLIASWSFPDQDLLAHICGDSWVLIPWYYNTLKVMRYWHGEFYTDDEVRVLHYVIDKPWQKRPKRVQRRSIDGKGCHEPDKHSDIVYEVDAGPFKQVKQGTRGLPADQANAVTHGWWWEKYEELREEMLESKYPYTERVDELVSG